ncbi:UDP-N-acetylglucosamine 4,6-dehydratase [hydrothermal vent metagenome]|uniref:UDP-N-acetylglucosamine 4,6-dehydratase n=1 Tax=hydrothermal vent metagenome TaxID=652676 RepID=A0A3B1BB87_9ZZZZ
MLLKALFKKSRHQLTVFLHDLVMVPVAWFCAYWLRFNLGVIPETYLERAVAVLPLLIVIQAGMNWFFGLYRGVWRFASIPDLIRILQAVTVALIVDFGLLFLVFRLEDVPRSVPIIFGVLLVMLLTGPRFFYRWLKDHHIDLRSGERVLIVGAGKAGEMLVRDLLRKGSHSYRPVAFVDNKQRWHGQDVHGIPVVDDCNAIPQVVEKYNIDFVMLAVPSARPAQMRHLVELCEQSGVQFRTVPELDALMSGRVTINQLREVSIEDLLGRDQISLNWDGISAGLKGKTILVTGSGGSIGSELCRQVARLEPANLLLLDHSEYNLYAIEMELGESFPDVSLHAYIGDVSDKATVERLFVTHHPDIVFHAAAYKHVPLLEHQIREAVHNNVLGTRVVALAASRHGCSEFVLISTDKAVNPTNIMGSTKRLAEIFCQNLNGRSETRFITVRFGNVLGSAGSVVPLFRKQIEAGGPITVTHPDMERYFMTIPEASQLIMQAAVIGDGGEIFVLDMNEPIKISYLAEQMIRLSGKVPGEDIEIKYIGLRPGEKLYEELFHDQEALEATEHQKIFLARHRKVDWEALETAMHSLEQACEVFDDIQLMEQLQTFVPENRVNQAND